MNTTFRKRVLSHGQLLQMRRWNTPTIYNGWEQVTSRNSARDCFNLEEVRDFMPQMGPMVGYAVTLILEPANPEHRKANPNAWIEYYRHVASVPGPKIVVVQDLEKPACNAACWGEVMANMHRALGCDGTLTDGAVRDIEWMTAAGFKAVARRAAVGHANAWPVRWNVPVEVFGQKIAPGDLVHADQHGFMVIPDNDQPKLLKAMKVMDDIECDTVIAAGRCTAGMSVEQMLSHFEKAMGQFRQEVQKRLSSEGEF